ncbi:MAG: hypothetical protein GC185_10520 [Alphaproteobacteria bacterium]|nr:hypothetical protein [Alphaproteobacteria bacterium]
MTEPKQQTLREIINKYSPIVRDKKGALGAALKTAAFPVEQTRNALGALIRFPISVGYTNTAGQSVEGCKAVVADTFRRMEKKLQASFNAAAAKEAGQQVKEAFLKLAEEVRADSRVLAKHCTVVSETWSTSPETYKFIVKVEKLGDELRKTTLDQGVYAVKKALGLIKEPANENPVKVRMKTAEEQKAEQDAQTQDQPQQKPAAGGRGGFTL